MKKHHADNKPEPMTNRTKGLISLFVVSCIFAVMVIMATFHLGIFKNTEPKVAVQTQVNTNTVPKAKPAAKSFYRALAEQQKISVTASNNPTEDSLNRLGFSMSNSVKFTVK